MQNILVTGGAGFIGSNLCKSLLEDNKKVICVDNLTTGDYQNIDPFIHNSNFKFIEQDVIEELDIDNIDFIFHLASPASPNKKNERSYIQKPIETLLANSLGSYRLLELARKNSSKFLYASSSEVYGDPKQSPQKEDYFGNVNPNGVRSVYDEGKRFGEAITMAYFRKFDLDIKIVRIFNTYGPKMVDDGRVITSFIIQALKKEPLTVYGDGKQTRSLCFIDDMVEGLREVMFSNKTKGEVLNLGNPGERTILELAELIMKLTNSNSKIIFEDISQDDPKRRLPDISKAKRLLGWEPKVGLEEGLRKTIEYLKS